LLEAVVLARIMEVEVAVEVSEQILHFQFLQVHIRYLLELLVLEDLQKVVEEIVPLLHLSLKVEAEVEVTHLHVLEQMEDLAVADQLVPVQE
jgi:hypothetical protein